jgi:peptide/nickel transport system permease protein
MTAHGTQAATVSRSRARRGVRGALRSPLMWVGGLLLLAIVVCAVAAPLFALGWGPEEIDFGSVLSKPSAAHIMGTDRNGMDIWARILFGARVDLLIAIAAIAIAVVIGSSIGALSGYTGRWVDEIIMRITDIFQAFPSFVLALAVAAVLGPGVRNLVVVVALVNLPAYIRLMRSEVIATRERAFVEAAKCQGLGPFSVLFRQVVPNCLNPIMVIAPLNCGWAMLTVAGLSFLGLGIPVPNPEWGSMISTGAGDVVAGQWWTSVFPGLALFLTVLAFNLFGEALRDIMARK